MCKWNILAHSLAIFAVLLAGCVGSKSTPHIPDPVPIREFDLQFSKVELDNAANAAKALICTGPESNMVYCKSGIWLTDSVFNKDGLVIKVALPLVVAAERFIDRNVKPIKPTIVVPSAADAAETTRIGGENTKILTSNQAALIIRKEKALPVAEFLYQLGKRHLQLIAGRDLVRPEMFLIPEKLYKIAAKAEHADALFGLASLYSSPAGSMESHNTAIDLYYRAAVAYLESSNNRAKAAEATEGIIRLNSGHHLAKSLNCQIVAPLNAEDCKEIAGISTPKRTRVSKEKDKIEPQEFGDKFPTITSTIFGVVTNRETAKSVYVNINVSDFSFGKSGSVSKGDGAISQLRGDRGRNATLGYDFTKQLSFAITTNMGVSDGRVEDLQGQSINLADDPTDTSQDFVVSGATLQFIQTTFYYYPHRLFYLGIGTFDGQLILKGTDGTGNIRQVIISVQDNLIVLGFTYDWDQPSYSTSRDPLSLKRNNLTPQLNIAYSLPANPRNSIFESLLTIGIGVRFF